MNETNLLRKLMLEASKIGNRLFRNNVGTAWTGNTIRLQNGDLLIKNPRPFHAGLCRGSSDLIGWTTKTVTPDMVGTKIAIFTAIEAKTGKLSATDEQKRFIETVIRHGGIARIHRE